MDIQKYVDELAEKALANRPPAPPVDSIEPVATDRLETVLPGLAVELWSDSSGRLFLVADEADAQLLTSICAARRGEIYTAAEVRRVIAVSDPAVVAEIHEWKRQFDARLSDHQARKGV